MRNYENFDFFEALNVSPVQRSHRFPFRIYEQIENIALAQGVPFSRVVNALLVEGLNSVALLKVD
jgi:hypothetical protein